MFDWFALKMAIAVAILMYILLLPIAIMHGFYIENISISVILGLLFNAIHKTND